MRGSETQRMNIRNTTHRPTLGPVSRHALPALLARAAGRAAAIALTGALLSAAGCSSASKKERTVIAEPPPPAYQPAPDERSVLRPVSEPIGMTAASGASEPEVLSRRRLSVARGPDGVAATAVETPAGELLRVTYSARNADVSDVMRVLLKEYLQQDYLIAPGVTGQITIELDDEFTRTELRELTGAIATLMNLTIEARDDVLLVRPGDRLPRAIGPVLPDRPALESDQPAVMVRRLRYAGGDQVATLLKELSGEGGKAIVVGRSIVIADTTRQLARLSRLIVLIDAPAFEGSEIWTYRLAYRKPEDVAPVLEKLASGAGISSQADAQAGFIPIPGTKRLMVIAKDPTLQPLIYDLVRDVDVSVEGEQRRRFIYRVQHYPQAGLVKLVQEFFGDRIEVPGAAGGPAAAAGATDQRMRLVADPQSDVLLIHATPNDYADLLSTLAMVDRPPQQVVIQSIIAEVRLTNLLQYGVEYFLSTSSALGDLELTGNTPIQAGAVATGSAFFIGGDGFAVIQALDRESTTRILSQPKVTVADRATASIQVGGEVPTIRATQGSSSQQGGSTDIREEIEYRETGVILSLEPQINESGSVRLKITQEVTDAIPTTIPNQPEFTTRKVETTVIVPHGKTVLLGGIIQRDERDSQNRIPILGRIPIAGEAFKNSADESERTELLLTITPRIINDPQEGAAFTGEFMQQIQGIRATLHEFAAEVPQGVLHNPDSPVPENAPPPPELPAETVPPPAPPLAKGDGSAA